MVTDTRLWNALALITISAQRASPKSAQGNALGLAINCIEPQGGGPIPLFVFLGPPLRGFPLVGD